MLLHSVNLRLSQTNLKRRCFKMKHTTIFLDLDGVIHKSKSVEEYNDKDVFSTVECYEGAKEFVKELQKLGEVIIISKCFVPFEDDRYSKQHFDKVSKSRQLGLPYHNIIVLPADIDKNRFCNDGDILIDDYGKNCESWENAGGISIQFNETNHKPWLTAKDYDNVLQKIKLIKSTYAY